MTRYFVDPFGCAKNQVDAENMMAALNGAGWSAAEDPAEADLIIVNSCGFIESAKRESLDALFAWRRRYPDKKILLAGCLARRYPGELAAALPEADALYAEEPSPPGIVTAAARALGAGPAADSPAAAAPGTASAENPGTRPLLSLPGSAYVKISEGCDNRCAFCAIPLIRGGLRSRPIPAIVAECRALLDRGVRELCLIGQDLGSYGRDAGPAPALPVLLKELAALEKDFWARLLYIHPDHFPREILDIMARDPRFLPYFDLPFQHGADRVLAAMGRRGRAADYLALIDEIRERLPGAVLRSTFMTGFPGETPADFDALLTFQARARLDWVGCFAYSREEGTPAFGMPGQVAKKTALRRKALVEARQVPLTEARLERFVGGEYDCLVEETIEDGLSLGRIYAQAPEVDGAVVITRDRPLQPGSLVRGRVLSRSGFDLHLRV